MLISGVILRSHKFHMDGVRKERVKGNSVTRAHFTCSRLASRTPATLGSIFVGGGARVHFQNSGW